jgi:hypothetical protein
MPYVNCLGHRDRSEREHRQGVGAGQRVVGERCGEELPQGGIVADRLVQRLTDALGDPTGNLAGDEDGIDQAAEVVSRGVGDEFDGAGLGIDLTNPLGLKGVGESGAVAAPPAVINAVLDALAAAGVEDIDMPATPERVWAATARLKHGVRW